MFNKAGLIVFQNVDRAALSRACQIPVELIALKRQQGHEPRSFNRLGNGMLANGSAACFAAPDNSTVPVDQFLQ